MTQTTDDKTTSKEEHPPVKTLIMTKVFVYGTLKKGFSNNGVLGKHARFLGPGYVEGYVMLSRFHFPAVVEAKEWEDLKVWGEVWEIEKDAMETSVDRLEGVPSHYQRKQETVYMYSDGDFGLCWMYIQPTSSLQINTAWVPSGFWAGAKTPSFKWNPEAMRDKRKPLIVRHQTRVGQKIKEGMSPFEIHPPKEDEEKMVSEVPKEEAAEPKQEESVPALRPPVHYHQAPWMGPHMPVSQTPVRPLPHKPAFEPKYGGTIERLTPELQGPAQVGPGCEVA